MQNIATESVDYIQAIFLALIQGITEFLPISSSAHLALVPLLTSWPDQGLAFDCVVHLGSLTAVVFYFRSDLARMASGFTVTLKQRSISADRDGYMAWLIGFATIPVGLFGLTFKDMIENDFRSLTVIGTTSIIFGLLLWLADTEDKNSKTESSWNLRDVMIIGVAQAIALIPGTSRSGITMTAALMMGYNRETAARFSFLLSIPVIILAGGIKIRDWIEQPDQAAGLLELLIGYGLSAISAYLCIHYFLKYLQRIGMGPFVIYRILLGAVLLWMVY
ncbi:undecaprenyl-diphosphate phosphatase [Mariprofundus sp. NF]|uniref:undecaprenyl-diphosphate phosphatase n=1 Tax=Mariprofundus sp. NF TaxID=2608716 RepID=UPI0015A0ECD6|nr:undecaprenyl-diphosphate phosphatase [Mariprofundus sp. NF]NWF38855.1 undecaprenyl-diphosphate phosphatase [Mariprofundus sp. NF]